jgi:hypothetical protein
MFIISAWFKRFIEEEYVVHTFNIYIIHSQPLLSARAPLNVNVYIWDENKYITISGCIEKYVEIRYQMFKK